MRNIHESVALSRNGWVYDREDDKYFPEAVVYTKRITGRVTEARAKLVLEYTRRFNKEHEALYGVSPNGYPYTCGCERDCCGCLYSVSMNVFFGHEHCGCEQDCSACLYLKSVLDCTSEHMNVFFGVNVITLKYTRTYNY